MIFQTGFSFIYMRIRSLRGAFTGNYISLIQFDDSNKLLIEFIECRHVGNRVTGIIYSIGSCDLIGAELKNYNKTIGIYKFNGFFDERIIAVSYKTKSKREKSVGNITMRADPSGHVFIGMWSGFEEQEVLSGNCHWFTTGKNYNKCNFTSNEIIKDVKNLVPSILNYSKRKEILKLLDLTTLNVRSFRQNYMYNSKNSSFSNFHQHLFSNAVFSINKPIFFNKMPYDRYEKIQSSWIKEMRELVEKRNLEIEQELDVIESKESKDELNKIDSTDAKSNAVA